MKPEFYTYNDEWAEDVKCRYAVTVASDIDLKEL